MKIPLLSLFPGIEVVATAGVDGLTFVVGTDSKMKKFVEASVALTLRWLEVLVIGSLVALAALIVHFRSQLAASWWISSWAVHNVNKAALIIAILTFICGCLLASWKRKQLFVYGVWEIVFGSFSAFQTALLLWPDGSTSKFVALASALYVISRGAGNVADAFVKEAERLKIVLQPGQEFIIPWPFGD